MKYTRADKLKILNTYLQMGEDRSLKRISTELGIPMGTINKMSITDNWKQKAVEYDREVLEEQRKILNTKIDKSKTFIIKNIIEIIKIHLERFKNPKTEVYMKDLILLIKCLQELKDEDVQHSSTNLELNLKLSDEDIKNIKSLDLKTQFADEEEEEENNEEK